MSAPRVELRDVTLRRRGLPVLDGVSLSLAPGSILAVLGPSGAGKTSLLEVVLGLVAPTSGGVAIDGTEASRAGKVVVPAHARGLGVVFQDLALWPHLSVRRHLEFVLAAQGVRPASWGARTEEVLTSVGLADKVDRRPGELSGGERQRVAIARALVGSPRAVLFDEPLANLDVVLKKELLALFEELLVARGLGALYVTHDRHEAERLADRLVVMEKGRFTQEGSPEELAEHPSTPFIAELFRDPSRYTKS